MSKVLLVLALISPAFVFASDVATCPAYCSGTTLYTNGYPTGHGLEAVCNYTEILNAEQCPPPVPPGSDCPDVMNPACR